MRDHHHRALCGESLKWHKLTGNQSLKTDINDGRSLMGIHPRVTLTREMLEASHNPFRMESRHERLSTGCYLFWSRTETAITNGEICCLSQDIQNGREIDVYSNIPQRPPNVLAVLTEPGERGPVESPIFNSHSRT